MLYISKMKRSRTVTGDMVADSELPPLKETKMESKFSATLAWLPMWFQHHLNDIKSLSVMSSEELNQYNNFITEWFNEITRLRQNPLSCPRNCDVNCDEMRCGCYGNCVYHRINISIGNYTVCKMRARECQELIDSCFVFTMGIVPHSETIRVKLTPAEQLEVSSWEFLVYPERIDLGPITDSPYRLVSDNTRLKVLPNSPIEDNQQSNYSPHLMISTRSGWMTFQDLIRNNSAIASACATEEDFRTMMM
jgi:hypothetical protein